MNSALPPYIALGSRLRGIPEVLTLGVKPNYFDYTPAEREMLAAARLILYPTLNYAQFFTTIGRRIFPSVETYLYADDKIKQTTLINLAGIPHPRTRFYYRPQHHLIRRDFDFPFVAKVPRASARGRGVFLVTCEEELKDYCELSRIAYIQEYLPHERDLRVVLINYQCVLAYWRQRAADNFRTNLHQGGTVDFEDIPANAVAIAQQYARCCKLNDVGLDLIHSKGKWHLIEANMQYGRQALQMKGLELKEIIREKLLAGELEPSS